MEEVFRVQILSVDERREQLVIDQAAPRKAKAGLPPQMPRKPLRMRTMTILTMIVDRTREA